MIRRVIALLAGAAYASAPISTSKLLSCFIAQKILRVNSSAAWPVHWTTQLKSPNKIARGSRFPGLAHGCYIDARNGIEIGENVWIGPGVSLISQNHDLSDYQDFVFAEPIRIGQNSLISARAVILPGVQLGAHTVVAAGAVVTKPFLEGDVLLAGVPARVIKKLGPYAGKEI